MSPWLSQAELIELTGYRWHSKQVLALDKMGVKKRVREDGFPLVERAQFERATGYNRRRTPNWAAIEGA